MRVWKKERKCVFSDKLQILPLYYIYPLILFYVIQIWQWAYIWYREREKRETERKKKWPCTFIICRSDNELTFDTEKERKKDREAERDRKRKKEEWPPRPLNRTLYLHYMQIWQWAYIWYREREKKKDRKAERDRRRKKEEWPPAPWIEPCIFIICRSDNELYVI